MTDCSGNVLPDQLKTLVVSGMGDAGDGMVDLPFETACSGWAVACGVYGSHGSFAEPGIISFV